MKTVRKHTEKITVEKCDRCMIDALKTSLSCKTQSAAVRKLLNCLDRLHQAEEKTRLEDMLEKIVEKKTITEKKVH
jgi:hypothetical protein